MKHGGKLFLTLACSILVVVNIHSRAAASWFIDPKKFHASVHGQTSCLECHQEAKERALHPNPEDVNKDLTAFFQVEHCLACHNDVLERLDKGLHGKKRLEEPARYRACLGCHNPHEQLPIKETLHFDPAKPREGQCGVCHEPKPALPAFSRWDEECMACHRLVDPKEKDAAEKMQGFCLYCHGRGGTEAQRHTGRRVSLIQPEEYRRTPHEAMACTACHKGAAAFGHDRQQAGECKDCHLPHDEKKAHDAHMRVACGACHLKGALPLKDPRSGEVRWQRGERRPGEFLEIHQMIRGYDEKTCTRCHVEGNKVGAAAMVLPAKGILCMPCHAATFSAGDTITVMSLAILVLGIVMLFSYWLTGSVAAGVQKGPFVQFLMLMGGALRTLFSPKIMPVLKAVLLDVLLQRRLYRQSGKRWFIHALIFYPFVLRFVWGLAALIGSLSLPERPWIWPMLDKDNPITAFLFDLTGLVLVAGLAAALVRGIRSEKDLLPGLPRQDRIALGLIAGTVIIGFVLESMRIAMTGHPAGSEWAFLGSGISGLFGDPAGLTGVYGYVWYLHALFTGAFIAYLPFSRLAHVIMAPVVLAMGAAREHRA